MTRSRFNLRFFVAGSWGEYYAYIDFWEEWIESNERAFIMLSILSADVINIVSEKKSDSIIIRILTT